MAPSLSMAPVAFTWFKAPSVGFWSLPQCVQRLWEWLKDVKHRGETRFQIKDWELAEELGIGRSCTQKALRWAEKLGLIRRYREHGRHHGRVVEILINLRGPKPKEAAKPKPGKKTRFDGQIPNVGTIHGASPEQQASALAAIAAAADAQAEEEEQPVPTAEDEARMEAFREEMEARRVANKIPRGRGPFGRLVQPPPSPARPVPTPAAERDEKRKTLARLEAQQKRSPLEEVVRQKLAAELANPGIPPDT